MYCTTYFSVCLEQWIRAKYERMEFIPGAGEAKQPYIAGNSGSHMRALLLLYLLLRCILSYFIDLMS